MSHAWIAAQIFCKALAQIVDVFKLVGVADRFFQGDCNMPSMARICDPGEPQAYFIEPRVDRFSVFSDVLKVDVDIDVMNFADSL